MSPSSRHATASACGPNPLAPWELRVGDLRIFYDVESEGEGIVRILAVGRKEGSVLRVTGKEVKL